MNVFFGKIRICISYKLSANKSTKFPFPVQFYCTQTLKYARQKWFCKKSEKWQNIKLCCNCNLHGNKYSSTCFITDINNDFFAFFTLWPNTCQSEHFPNLKNSSTINVLYIFALASMTWQYFDINFSLNCLFHFIISLIKFGWKRKIYEKWTHLDIFD